jgi:hypothetical protein
MVYAPRPREGKREIPDLDRGVFLYDIPDNEQQFTFIDFPVGIKCGDVQNSSGTGWESRVAVV